MAGPMIETSWKNIKIACSMVLFTFAFATDALPDILNVPTDYLTIQEAIHASESGDTIMVGSGVHRLYAGGITVVKKSIIIKSAEGAKKTIIEGRGKGPVITFPEDCSSIIDGFTITSISKANFVDIQYAEVISNRLNVRSGPGTDYPVVGTLNKGERRAVEEIIGPWINLKFETGWIHTKYATLSLGCSENDIEYAGIVSGTLNGGGIYCASSSSPTIANNIICGNSALFGGGIYCAPSSSPAIVGNVISKNNAARFGGGIFSCKASPTARNNRIMENEASNAGGGIFCRRGSPRITNNVIWKNQARSGGGISCERSSCSIINDTITENRAIYGGGVFFQGGSVRIVNTIFWNNQDDLYSRRISPAVRPNHSNIGDGDFRGLNGNICADPLFADPKNSDFRLRPDSPCINAGNPASIYNDPDKSRNDMGAYGGPKAHL
jgi:hypothetical protein